MKKTMWKRFLGLTLALTLLCNSIPIAGLAEAAAETLSVLESSEEEIEKNSSIAVLDESEQETTALETVEKAEAAREEDEKPAAQSEQQEAIDLQEVEILDSGTCGENLTWSVDSNGVLTISGTGEMYSYYSRSDDGKEVAPWKKSYFFRVESLTALVLENGVTTIGEYAFEGCRGFSGDLVIPDSVTTIGYAAFKGCSGFSGNLVIGNSVTTIGNSAFCFCSGFSGNLVIGNSVTTIESSAFNDCSGFSGDLVIPDSVTTIESSAFNGCSGFSGNLVIPDSVTTIESSAFSDCRGFSGDLVIPDSMTTIESWAFNGCSGFSGDLVIPDSMTTIKNSAFEGCSGFSGDLVIPDSMTTIQHSAFEGCSGFSGDLVIPDSMTTIEYAAFKGCSGFSGNLVIGNSVTTIQSSAFRGCSGFSGDLVIPDSMTTIESSAFNGCSGFSGDLVIPDNVTIIGESAFAGVLNISKVVMTALSACQLRLKAFPESTIICYPSQGTGYEDVTENGVLTPGLISTYPEYDWRPYDNIDDLNISFRSGKCGENVRWKIVGETLIISGTGTMDSYENHMEDDRPWRQYRDDITKIVIEDCSNIGAFAFCGLKNVTDVTFKLSFKGDGGIGNCAFAECDSIREIRIPYVSEIGMRAFSGCDALETVFFLDEAPVIDSTAFRDDKILAVYHDSKKSWKEFKKDNFEGTITWKNVSFKMGKNNFNFGNKAKDILPEKSYEVYKKEKKDGKPPVPEENIITQTSYGGLVLTGGDSSNLARIIRIARESGYYKGLFNELKTRWCGSCEGMVRLASLLFYESILGGPDAYAYFNKPAEDSAALLQTTEFYLMQFMGAAWDMKFDELMLVDESYASALEALIESIRDYSVPTVCGIASEDKGHSVILTQILSEKDKYYVVEVADLNLKNFDEMKIYKNPQTDSADFISIEYQSGLNVFSTKYTKMQYWSRGLEDVDPYKRLTVSKKSKLIEKYGLVTVELDNAVFTNENGENILEQSTTNGTFIPAYITEEGEYESSAKSYIFMDEGNSGYNITFENKESVGDVTLMTKTLSASLSMYTKGNGVLKLDKSNNSVDAEFDNNSNYTLSLSVEESNPSLPYSMISVYGKDTKKATMELTDAGIKISGDNLNNMVVVGEDIENREELVLSTEHTEALITTENDSLIVLVDSNGDGTFEDSVSTKRTDISSANVTLAEAEYVYDGTEKMPEVTVTLDGQILNKDSDYTVEYYANTDAGTAYVSVFGTGLYTGMAESEFIIQKSGQDLEVTVSSETIHVGDTAEITASAEGAISYETVDENVATVDESGIVTGIAAGTVEIKILAAETDNYLSAEQTVSIHVVENQEETTVEETTVEETTVEETTEEETTVEETTVEETTEEETTVEETTEEETTVEETTEEETTVEETTEEETTVEETTEEETTVEETTEEETTVEETTEEETTVEETTEEVESSEEPETPSKPAEPSKKPFWQVWFEKWFGNKGEKPDETEPETPSESETEEESTEVESSQEESTEESESSTEEQPSENESESVTEPEEESSESESETVPEKPGTNESFLTKLLKWLFGKK